MRAFRIPGALLVTVLVIGCVDGPTSPPSDGVVPEFSRNNDRASPVRGAPTSEWVEELFIDYRAAPVHGGPGPHPTVESATFRLTQGGISWPSGTAVYRILGTEPGTVDNGAGNTAIVAAEVTWDGAMGVNRSFSRTGTLTENPCTEEPNTVQWVTIDEEGPILATASVCRNVATKEIAGFVISIDKDEPWTIGGTPTTFDVENVVSHEFGHVAGLGHVNAPRDGCLTMYKFVPLNETRKRSLGLGDKLGMDALYNTGDTNAGPGCELP